MASGSFSGGIYGNHYRLRVDWNSEINIAGNYSLCTFYFYLEQDKGYDLSISARTNSIIVDGVSYSWSSPAVRNSGNITTHLGSAQINIYHNEMGTKTANISVSFNIQATLKGVYYGSITASASIALDTICRTSTAEFLNVFSVGESVTVNIARSNDKFKHTLAAVIGNTETLIASNVDAQHVWETGSWADGMFWKLSSTGLETVYGSLRLHTFYEGTYIGCRDTPFTAHIPKEYNGESIFPSVECSLIAENGDDFPEGLKGQFVKARSKIRADFTGSFYNSSIGLKEYALNVKGGPSVSSSEKSFVSSEYINVPGEEIIVVCSVTDQSGRTAQIEKTISVKNYSPPVVVLSSCDRCIFNEETGLFEKNKLGEKVRFGATLVPGTGYTDGEISLFYEIYSGDYREGAHPKESGAINSGVDVIPELHFDKTEAFTVRVWAEDAFGAGNAVFASIPVAKPVFHAPEGGNGFAMGMFAESDGFFRSAYPMLGVPITHSEKVTISGMEFNLHFSRFGNVTVMNLHAKAESTLTAEAKEVLLTIPEAFSPDESQITGNCTVASLFGRGDHTNNIIGGVSIYDKKTIYMCYSVGNFGAGWVFGTMLTWINEPIKTE